MRRLLIWPVLSGLSLAILAVAWIVAGPRWARALDAIHTTRMATASSFSIRKYSGFFRFFSSREGAPQPEAGGFTWYDWGNPHRRSSQSRAIPSRSPSTVAWRTGQHRSKSPAVHRWAVAAAGIPGHVTSILSRVKIDRARLDMLARFEQHHESGSGRNEPGAAALVRLDIQPHY